MGTSNGCRIISLCVTLTWLVKVKLSSAYYETNVSGYVFSIPGFNDQEKRNQANAQTWCTENHSKLLEITSDEIQRLTVSFINNAISQRQMTGNTIITNGKRFGSTHTWVTGIALSSSITVKGQEPGLSHSYGYINITSSGFEIVVDTPTGKRGYICEGSSFCTNGFKTNERCYRSSSVTLSWYDARNRCIDAGGDLASFDFITDNAGFSALNFSGLTPPSTYWIGFRRQGWKWQRSGSDVRYSQWLDGHPVYNQYNGECLCLDPNNPKYDWKWIECDCNPVYQFVCMTGITTSSTSRDAVSTTASAMTIKPTITTVTSTALLEISSSLVANPGSKSTTTFSNLSSVNTNNAVSLLGVGLGVGIGGGAFIAVVIAIVFITIRRQGCYRKSGFQKQSVPPDVTPESYYAKVVKFDNATMDAYSNQYQPPTEYADLNIAAATKSSIDGDQTSLSLVQPRTATLLAPSSDKNGPVHFVVNGAMYAVVQEN